MRLVFRLFLVFVELFPEVLDGPDPVSSTYRSLSVNEMIKMVEDMSADLGICTWTVKLRGLLPGIFP